MNYFESILLGLVQGLGEFLPISSSAHLVVLPWIVNFKDPGLAFDVALHLGTLFAVVAYFWKDWWVLSRDTLLVVKNRSHSSSEQMQSFKLMMYLVIATLPAVVAGLLLKDYAESSFRSPWLIALNMIVLGVVLFFADRWGRQTRELNQIDLKTVILIGLAQCVALLPGSSRSGCTITAGLLLGLSRTDAARFSFLMSTPIILGACVLEYKYIGAALTSGPELIGILVSALIGFLSIKFLMKLVQNFSYLVFCYKLLTEMLSQIVREFASV